MGSAALRTITLDHRQYFVAASAAPDASAPQPGVAMDVCLCVFVTTAFLTEAGTAQPAAVAVDSAAPGGPPAAQAQAEVQMVTTARCVQYTHYCT